MVDDLAMDAGLAIAGDGRRPDLAAYRRWTDPPNLQRTAQAAWHGARDRLAVHIGL